MRKILLSLVAILAVSFSVSAQSTRYHGEVYLSGGYGIGSIAFNNLQLNTIHGVRVGECFSAGLGVGVDWHTPDFDSGIFMVPLFADFKLYAPTASKVDPFLMVDIGYAFAAEEPQLGGLKFGAGLGFKAGIFALSLGYHLQQLGTAWVNFNLSALQLKLGFAF